MRVQKTEARIVAARSPPTTMWNSTGSFVVGDRYGDVELARGPG